MGVWGLGDYKSSFALLTVDSRLIALIARPVL